MAEQNGKNPLVEQTDTDRELDREGEVRLGMSMLAKVVLTVVVLVSLIISITCVMRYNRAEEEKAHLEAQLKTNNEMIAELQYWQAHPIDEQYIEEFAGRYGLEYADAKLLLEVIHGMADSAD